METNMDLRYHGRSINIKCIVRVKYVRVESSNGSTGTSKSGNCKLPATKSSSDGDSLMATGISFWSHSSR